jgi:hypothetical protein
MSDWPNPAWFLLSPKGLDRATTLRKQTKHAILLRGLRQAVPGMAQLLHAIEPQLELGLGDGCVIGVGHE